MVPSSARLTEKGVARGDVVVDGGLDRGPGCVFLSGDALIGVVTPIVRDRLPDALTCGTIEKQTARSFTFCECWRQVDRQLPASAALR